MIRVIFDKTSQILFQDKDRRISILMTLNTLGYRLRDCAFWEQQREQQREQKQSSQSLTD